MNEPDILYPAIFVFTMLLIGLSLTVWEFSRIEKPVHQKARKGSTSGDLEKEAAHVP